MDFKKAFLVGLLVVPLAAQKPLVVFKMQIFVDPAGVLARNASPRVIEKNKSIVLKRIIKDFQDQNINLLASYKKDITRSQFNGFFTHKEDGERHYDGDTLAQKALYMLDVVIGEDQNGLRAGAWLINVKTGAVYRQVEARIPKREIRFVIQSLIKIVDELKKSFSNAQSKFPNETIADVIKRTETPVRLAVRVSKDTASMSHDRTVAITVNNITNAYGQKVWNYLKERMFIAAKLAEGSPGLIVSGEPVEGSLWRIHKVKDGVVTIVYKLPSPEAFRSGQNPLKVDYVITGVDFATKKVLEGELPKMAGYKSFFVKADYAWHVVENWDVRSKDLNLSFKLEYDLHYCGSCADYLLEDFFYSAMKAKQAFWYSDNFVRRKYDPLKSKGVVKAVKYTDCGILDPWTLADGTIDTVYVVGFGPTTAKRPPLEQVQTFHLCYYFGGATLKNAVDDQVDIFDLFNARVVGEFIVPGFKDINAYVTPMIDIDKEKLMSFKPFTNTSDFTYVFTNGNCGEESVEVRVTQEFKPVFEFECIATREEYGGKGGGK